MRAASRVLGLACCALLAATPVGTLDSTARPRSCRPSVPESCTLRELASLAGIRFGSTAEQAEVADPQYASTLAREFSSLTPENAMKWYSVQPAPGHWSFAQSDAIVDFAQAHSMEVRGHTLVWAQDRYTPSWVTAISDTQALRTAVAVQIATVMTRYAGRVHRWDVVNEPLDTLGTGPSRNVFRTLGPDWIADAFRFAHAVDPAAQLWINEYGTDWVPGKHDAYLALVRDLVTRGVPIHGVGLQVHRLPGQVADGAALRAQIQDFADLGLEVAVTELDVPTLPSDPNALTEQATEYETIVRACLSVRACREVTTWGLTDRYTWLDSLGYLEVPTRPLLFDDDYRRKPAYDSVRAVLAEVASTAHCHRGHGIRCHRHRTGGGT